jgi:hypothetical protein
MTSLIKFYLKKETIGYFVSNTAKYSGMHTYNDERSISLKRSRAPLFPIP